MNWLRGEAKHCSMVAVPTLAQEDARRSNREHEHLVGERTRILNRLKATVIRHGIRSFNVKLRKAAERLADTGEQCRGSRQAADQFHEALLGC